VKLAKGARHIIRSLAKAFSWDELEVDQELILDVESLQGEHLVGICHLMDRYPMDQVTV